MFVRVYLVVFVCLNDWFKFGIFIVKYDAIVNVFVWFLFWLKFYYNCFRSVRLLTQSLLQFYVSRFLSTFQVTQTIYDAWGRMNAESELNFNWNSRSKRESDKEITNADDLTWRESPYNKTPMRSLSNLIAINSWLAYLMSVLNGPEFRSILSLEKKWPNRRFGLL